MKKHLSEIRLKELEKIIEDQKREIERLWILLGETMPAPDQQG